VLFAVEVGEWKEIRGLANSHVDRIDKKAFLVSFKEVFSGSFSR
jgi:hypothetical protein